MKIMNAISAMWARFVEKQQRGAQKAFLDEFFNDYYRQRVRVYKMNFVRGVMFGLGSVLGGTIVVAILTGILSFFVDFPLIGETIRDANQTIQRGE